MISDDVVNTAIATAGSITIAFLGYRGGAALISRRRRARPVDEEESDDDRILRYENDPKLFIRDVLKDSELIHIQLQDARSETATARQAALAAQADSRVMAKLAIRAVRYIEAQGGPNFDLTKEEHEALERTRPLI